MEQQRKTAIVTGASRGIGKAIAKALFDRGCNVVLNYQTNQKAAETLAKEWNDSAKDQRALAIRADVSDPTAVSALFDEAEKAFGPVDILVNNAGIAQQKLFTDLTPTDWNTMVGVNLNGVFYCSQQALLRMIPRHCGRIINISSMWGQVGASCEVHYSAVKAAVIGMTKALAKEVGPSGITVNCVCPGVIDTDMNQGLSADDLAILRDETPMGMIGTPEDIAAAVVFFVQEQSGFITGQILGVNGGFVI